MADPLILVRGVHFAATLLACGTVAFTVLVAEPAGTKSQARSFRRQLTTLIWLALAAAILSGAVWLVLLASDILGASFVDICLHGGAWPVLFDTRFGLVWCARFALALLLGLLMLWPAARGLQLAAASALAALPALVGHAGATPGTAGEVHLVSDMVHLLASSAWLGGLPAFVLLLWQARRTAEPTWYDFTIRATHRFSVVGILSVGALLASGLINSWNLMSGPRDLVISDYGRLVALEDRPVRRHGRHCRGEPFLPDSAPARPFRAARPTAQQSRGGRSWSLRLAVRRRPRNAATGGA